VLGPCPPWHVTATGKVGDGSHIALAAQRINTIQEPTGELESSRESVDHVLFDQSMQLVTVHAGHGARHPTHRDETIVADPGRRLGTLAER
jgi:hypothetical protein